MTRCICSFVVRCALCDSSYNISTMQKLVLTLLILCAFTPCLRAEEALLDRVVAVVNDEIITQAELDSVLRPLYEDYKQQFDGEELVNMVKEARSKILSQIIEDRLVYQEAVAQKVEIKEDEIDKEIQSLSQRMDRPEELDVMLEREGMTLKDLRQKMKKQLMIRRLQDIEVRSKVVVSPTELETFYKENPEKFRKSSRVKVRSLTIKKSAEARDKGIADEGARDRIESFFLKIKQGEDFEGLVVKFSEDSRANEKQPEEWIEKGTMIESVDEAIFETPAGKMTGIVESPIGFHIFRIEEKEEARQVPFEEARDQIANYLFQMKSNDRFKEWVQQLKRTAYISIR
ncbi:MAG: Chaperone SurA precursor [Candidatus Omnitrophica bacterium ADurb.Bin277]|nr:MAG: Chaperone SurA precursor [Candidatus Omnitrophica bacterium ADurb.Bin277]